jgi:hypothetical protein
MNSFLNGGISNIAILKHGRTRSINSENITGAKGKGGMASSNLGVSRKGSPCIRNIKTGETRTIAEITGPAVITHIFITVTDITGDDDFVLRDLVFRIYWDNEEEPSVETPLGDFFCCGFGRGTQVNSLPISVNPNKAMHCFFPMPFSNHAKITIENQHPSDIPGFFYQIDYCEYDELPSDAVYFHAQWRRENPTTKMKDYTILDNVKGKGHYVGTYLALTTLERYWWGEGEIKVYLDGDKEFPTIVGTGTEDYFGGAWSFASQREGKTVENNFCTPFMGYPYFSRNDDMVHNPYHLDDEPTERGLYRFHILDPIIFEKDLRVTIQQIGVCRKGLFERSDDVSSVAYWYQTEPHNAFPEFPTRDDRIPR